MYKVKVYGPSASGTFGIDAYVVDSPTDVQENDLGTLVIKVPGTPPRPHPRRDGTIIHATRSSSIIYPRGGWTKVIVVDIVDEEGE